MLKPIVRDAFIDRAIRRQCPWCESYYVPLRRKANGGEDCRCGSCFRWFWHQEDRREHHR